MTVSSGGDLPAFIPPMLAVSGKAFDAADHLFEIKWDGFRAQALVGAGTYRLLGRKRTDFTARYPELAFLAELPPGSALDGELVAMVDGKPSFEHMLRSEPGVVAFVVFDLMLRAGEALVQRPLRERREHLAEIVRDRDNPRLVLSDGVVGEGRAFFEQVCAQGLEGMVAKDLSSPYEPGLRTGAWTKVKQSHEVLCAILGYAVDDTGGLKSLILATNEAAGLRYVGKVGSGLSEALRRKLRALCDERRVDAPLVACDAAGRWVAPGLYCNVRYVERTSSGMLRAPVFRNLITDA